MFAASVCDVKLLFVTALGVVSTILLSKPALVLQVLVFLFLESSSVFMNTGF